MLFFDPEVDRTQHAASLLSVISMVSALMGMGCSCVSMRSWCTVAIGFDVPQAVRIKNEKIRIKSFVFIFYMSFFR